MAQTAVAKVFRNGRSQAVRIPAEFRFKTDEVYIERDEASGVVKLSERPLHTSMADLFAEINAEGGLEFEVEKHTYPPDKREEWLR